MDAFLVALQFLTRIPVSVGYPVDLGVLGRSVLYYPVIGLLLGGLLSLMATILAGGSPILSAALVLFVWALITGGLHLDGLADCADAWVGGHGDKQRSLEIMKDPASGPVAVSVLVLILLVKFAALTTLFEQTQLLPVLIAPALGRAAILALLLSTPYLRPQGLGATLSEQLPRVSAQATLAGSVLLAAAFLGLPAVLAAAATVFWVRRSALSRLGGTTGDVYGAAVELTEAAVLTAAAF